jgi:hypothetical protein
MKARFGAAFDNWRGFVKDQGGWIAAAGTLGLDPVLADWLLATSEELHPLFGYTGEDRRALLIAMLRGKR